MQNELRSVNLAHESISQTFAEQGYAIARGIFRPDELVVLERDFDRIVSQISTSGENVEARWSGPEMDRLNAGSTSVIHTHNVQHYSAAWMCALLQERFISAAKEILGPDIVLHHTKLFQKPAELGAPFPMHQDWTYFPSKRDSMVAGIIHISKATDEMGCLRVYPGTHKLGRWEGTSGGSESELLSQYPIEGAIPLEAEPGDVVFFHYFTIHGSMPNRSSDVRKTVLVQMHAGDDEMEEGHAHPYEALTLSGFNSCMGRGQAGRMK